MHVTVELHDCPGLQGCANFATITGALGLAKAVPGKPVLRVWERPTLMTVAFLGMEGFEHEGHGRFVRNDL